MWRYQLTGILCKGRQKENELQEFMYGDTTNVEHVMYDYISHNCSHWNGNIKIKENFGSHTRKTFNRFTTKTDIGLLRTQHEKFCTLNLEPERLGSLLVREEKKYRWEKDCDKRQ
jgi:hypothetical protein